MNISKILSTEYDVTRIPLYLDNTVRTQLSPQKVVKGFELVNSIELLDTQIKELKKAKRNAEAVLNGEIIGSLDIECLGSLAHKAEYINAP